MPNERRVWEALRWDEWRDAREISDEAGLERGRTCEAVRTAVRNLRELGMPVVSGECGFMKTTSAAELIKNAKLFFAKAASLRVSGERFLDAVENPVAVAAHEDNIRRLFLRPEDVEAEDAKAEADE